jgi:hypothetical protein
MRKFDAERTPMSMNAAGKFGSDFLAELPLGAVGVILIAAVAFCAFTLGSFSFYGLAFLIYWPVLGAVRIFYAFIAVWGVILECSIWKRAARSSQSGVWSGTPQFWLGAAALGASVVLWAVAHAKYLCLIVAGSPLPFAIVVGAILCQYLIIRSLRDAQRNGAAFIALLILETLTTFLTGEAMAADQFRKTLQHMLRDQAAVGYISASNEADLVVDKARKEFVLKVRGGASAAPFELRRPFPPFACD